MINTLPGGSRRVARWRPFQSGALQSNSNNLAKNGDYSFQASQDKGLRGSGDSAMRKVTSAEQRQKGRETRRDYMIRLILRQRKIAVRQAHYIMCSATQGALP
ncbi:hypothetical protein [Chitinilyticum litopenaei]|uniref:hypothetical protein n=1 Tax=Chitinilyticum litopenaei TaxID=1121276 RepID=UPI00118541F4|nr:hypothetical protein [Chitinilyticum litopenaei]